MKRAIDNLIGAIGMFTRLPTPYSPLLDSSLGLLICYPLVGLIIGGLWYGLWLLLVRAGVSALMAGGLLAVFPLFITGFMHMDGFMDVMDALLSGRDREKRLKILKDPNAGAFSVCAFGCVLLLQFTACTEIYTRGWYGTVFLWLPVLSRALSALAISCPPLLESSRLGRTFGAGAGAGSKLWFALSAAAAAFALSRLTGFMPPIGAVTACGLGLWWALRELGGTSGDVAGFCLILTEASCLFLTALL